VKCALTEVSDEVFATIKKAAFALIRVVTDGVRLSKEARESCYYNEDVFHCMNLRRDVGL
jgi:hypothetical protein